MTKKTNKYNKIIKKIDSESFTYLWEKYFSKMSKLELSHLILALTFTNQIYNIEGFIKENLEIIISQRKQINMSNKKLNEEEKK